MKKVSGISLCVFSLLVFASCASMDSPEVDEIYVDAQDMADDISWDILDILRDKAPVAVVIYPFSGDKGSMDLTGSIAEDLNIFLANAASEENVALAVVTRQAIDGILAELSFQMSDLADETRRLTVGKLVGANVMVTGTITQRKTVHEVKVQVIDIKSGVILGGTMFRIAASE